MAPVSVQIAHGELIPEQVKLAGSEIKQGADARITLLVVISEGTLVIAEQLGPPIVHAPLPTTAEALVNLEFHCTINADRVDETIRFTIGGRSSGGSGSSTESWISV